MYRTETTMTDDPRHPRRNQDEKMQQTDLHIKSKKNCVTVHKRVSQRIVERFEGRKDSLNRRCSMSPLSSRDPISKLVMTTNFKRFASIIGPAFWLQDHNEEVILCRLRLKRGWFRTTVCMPFSVHFNSHILEYLTHL